MPTVKKHLQIFLSHSSDTKEHVKVIGEVINNINTTLDNYHLDLFEHKSDTTPGAGHPQKVIFDQCPVNTWDIYIALLWHRFGFPLTYEGKKYESGVEVEFEKAYELWESSGGKKPKILFYQSNIPIHPKDVDPKQLEKVYKSNAKIYYSSYEGLEELKTKLIEI